MELRVLKYFLTVAEEENITKAARLLHITQPTLSRQLMQLEEELGVTLFHRGKYRISLTKDGLLLQQRAKELVLLSEKTKKELLQKNDILSGELSIGCGETKNMSILSSAMMYFQQQNLPIKFHIYSAAADEVQEKIENGLLDIGLLTEPVDVKKYEYIHMPVKEQWGVLVRNDSPLAYKKVILPEDLLGVPLLITHREMVKQELISWFGEEFDRLDVIATYNLIINAANMVESGLGNALCFDLGLVYGSLRFIPLSPKMETGSVLVWKKNQMLSDLAWHFIHHIKNSF